jgi:hypothetical protein
VTENTFDPKAFVEQLLAQPGSQPDERAVIESRKSALRADNAARDELAAETAPAIPAAYPGNEFLTQPDESPAWRIASLWPAGGNVVLAAQFKAGKTTLRDNLIKAWCDGEAFLGAYVITPPVCPLFVIDAEMAPTMARRWLKAHSIEHPERFTYANIRGGAAAFNPLASALRAQWAKRITGSAAVLLDCLGPVMGALGLDENKAADIGRFLASFEQLLAEAGVSESFVIHHMGHAAERSRGASRLRDWPDAEWRLVRQDDDPASDRYLSAFGRDVEVPESRLGFDPETRRLTLDGGSRQDTRVAGARAAVIELLTGQPGLSTNAISDQLSEEHGRNAVRAALAALVKDREVTIQKGPRRSKPHSLTAPVGQCATTTPPA